MENPPASDEFLESSLQDFLGPIPDKDLNELALSVEIKIRDNAPIGVAFSGGVDSTLLLALCVRTLGKDNVKAIIGVSPSLAKRELEAARELSKVIGTELIEIDTNEIEDERYLNNEQNRCFFCKDHLFNKINNDVLPNLNLKAIAFGEIATDLLSNDRPGSLAATKHNIMRPLADVGFEKEQVRNLAKILGLPNWNKPSSPCLASRIPFFTRIDTRKLSQVEIIENFLHDLGFQDLRLRHNNMEARIELSKKDLDIFFANGLLRDKIYDKIMSEGFKRVVLNLKELIR
jgi:uncharacterized protein